MRNRRANHGMKRVQFPTERLWPNFVATIQDTDRLPIWSTCLHEPEVAGSSPASAIQECARCRSMVDRRKVSDHHFVGLPKHTRLPAWSTWLSRFDSRPAPWTQSWGRTLSAVCERMAGKRSGHNFVECFFDHTRRSKPLASKGRTNCSDDHNQNTLDCRFGVHG